MFRAFALAIVFVMLFTAVPVRADDDPDEPPIDPMEGCPPGVEICASDLEFWHRVKSFNDNGTLNDSNCYFWRTVVKRNTNQDKFKVNSGLKCDGDQDTGNMYQFRLKRAVPFQGDPTLDQKDIYISGNAFQREVNLWVCYQNDPNSQWKYYWDISAYGAGSAFPHQHLNSLQSQTWPNIELWGQC